MHRIEASLSPQQRSKSVFPPRTRLHNQTPAKGEPGSDGDDDGDDGDGDGDDHNDDDDDERWWKKTLLHEELLYFDNKLKLSVTMISKGIMSFS